MTSPPFRAGTAAAWSWSAMPPPGTLRIGRRGRAEAVVEWGRRNAAPKIRGQFQRVFQDVALRVVFRSLSRGAADSFDWVYGHHIPWGPARSEAAA
ncbi:hypothetical protein [Arthrobacter sp. ISL-5]|uniref:hypothetical protein n=1 Tax=Arthrobacter sp. ISL-5 TaxID=2819111 RepID=UPI001BEBE06F|nr:hypothetical protein [Arthrobacter sp. ISL-5]MBT2552190.1 hypothetical protein [Arthrobacter sp. ISL-5]